jgi:putative ABC transport system permease protein
MPRLIFFFRFFFWFSLRNMRKSPARALTVLCGIALGAAVFTSIRLSVHASLDSFTRSMDMIAGSSDRVVNRPGGYVPEDLVPELLRRPCVDSASPLLTTYVRPAGEEAPPFLLIGIDPLLDRSLRKWRMTEPGDRQIAQQPASRQHQMLHQWLELLRDPYTLVIGKPLRKMHGWCRGDRIRLATARGSARFRIAGVLAPEGLALVDGGMAAVTDIASFQEFTGRFGMVDRIDLRLKEGTGPEDLENLESLLPEQVVLSPPSAAKESGRGMIRAYQLNLSILSFASLFVGMFLVYSLVALNAASRRHELAVLRSTGASSGFLFLLFLGEGAFLGIAGWLAALPVSSLLVKYLLHGVSRTISTLFVRVHVETLSLSPWETGLSFAVTVVISVLAALQPAREAMLVSPKEAMEISRHGERAKKSPGRPASAGLMCILAALLLSGLPGFVAMPVPGYLSILMLFVGFSLLAPWCLTRLGMLASPFLRKRAGIPAYLAGRTIRDSGTRTAVSVGALITAVALYTSLVIMIFSFRQTVEIWAKQSVGGDLFLTTRLNEINEFRHPIPPEAAAWFKALDKDVEIVPNKRYFLTYGRFPYEFEALDIGVFSKYADFFWMKGDPETIRPMLAGGEGVIVSEVFSNRTGLTIGDRFRAGIEFSAVDLQILGIVRDYRTQGGVVFYSMAHFVDRFHDPGWSGVRIFFKDRGRNLRRDVADLRAAIVDRWGDRLDLITGRELRTEILRVFDETFAVTTVLLLIALAVAGLGIATTLTVRVMERSRQLNTLFAVGAGFGQIRRLILWEAAFLVVAGELAGLVCGFMLSYLLVYVINRQSFGWTFLYRVDWGALGLSVPLIILAALTAALPAIRMVFRKPPATLLRE